MVISCGKRVRDLGVGVVVANFAAPILFPVCCEAMAFSAPARSRREGGLSEGGVDGPLDCVATSEKSVARSGVGGMEGAVA